LDIGEVSRRDQPWEPGLSSSLTSSTPFAAPDLLLRVSDLACLRGGRLVFSGVSFTVGSGELLALVGPNGSGKSSLLRILAGLLPPHSGAFVLERAAEDATHYLGHVDALKPALSLRETLRFWAALYRGEAGGCEAAADRVGLAHALDLPVRVLSAGQRRRAGLARLLLAPRPLWLLDEPTAALDREGEAVLGELMREHLAGGGVIIAATHGDLPVAANAVLDMAARP
jgi:heme exporter protein A